MQFPNKYFEDEVRDGFYIPSMVKKGWATELDVLAEVDRICRLHDIKYYAEWGTLLGAVRHGGFIPWDDDLDIGMHRSDYKRFCEIAPKEFADGFEIFTFRNHKDYHYFLARVVCKNRICFEDEHLRRYHGFPYIAGLDIFVHDNVSDDDEAQNRCEKIAEYVITVADAIGDGRFNAAQEEDALKRINSVCRTTYRTQPDKEKMRIELYCLAEDLFASFEHENTKYMTQMMPQSLYGRHMRIPKEYYDKVIRIPFENTTIPVPVGFDAMLKKRYGYYMKLVKDAGGHDYPFFETQKKQLDALLDFKLPEYRFSADKAKRTSATAKTGYKEVIKEALNYMESMVGEILSAYPIQAQDKLADLQQLAIDMGNYIEQVKGEKAQSVICIERLCEVIYHIYQGEDGNLSDAFNKVKAQIDKDILSRREIVFMPYKASQWVYVEKMYESLKDETTDVRVVVLPYYYKEYDGTCKEYVYEGDDFLKELNVINALDYDVELYHPDVIYIQCPFDGENKTLSVVNEFYSDRLKEHTDKLIYVQSFMLDDFTKANEREYKNMYSYCTVPGVVNSDEVIVWSDHIRSMYIEKLTEFAGEETRQLWEGKISVHTYCDGEIKQLKGDGCVAKKTLLLYTSVSGLLEYKEKAVDKLKNVLTVLEEYKDTLDVVWCVQDSVETVLNELEPQLMQELKQLFDSFKKCGYGYLCNDSDNQSIISCDCYYGDVSRWIQSFRNYRKAVMVINYDII